MGKLHSDKGERPAGSFIPQPDDPHCDCGALGIIRMLRFFKGGREYCRPFGEVATAKRLQTQEGEKTLWDTAAFRYPGLEFTGWVHYCSACWGKEPAEREQIKRDREKGRDAPQAAAKETAMAYRIINQLIAPEFLGTATEGPKMVAWAKQYVAWHWPKHHREPMPDSVRAVIEGH